MTNNDEDQSLNAIERCRNVNLKAALKYKSRAFPARMWRLPASIPRWTSHRA